MTDNNSETTDYSDDFEQIFTNLSVANREIADAIDAMTWMGASENPGVTIRRAYPDLLNAYQTVSNTLELMEQLLSRSGEELRSGTLPRQLLDEHSTRVKEQYDSPVREIALQILEYNRVHWLYRKPETNGSEDVVRHGFTANQRAWLDELQSALEATTTNREGQHSASEQPRGDKTEER